MAIRHTASHRHPDSDKKTKRQERAEQGLPVPPARAGAAKEKEKQPPRCEPATRAAECKERLLASVFRHVRAIARRVLCC
jgi:hypothetical protein